VVSNRRLFCSRGDGAPRGPKVTAWRLVMWWRDVAGRLDDVGRGGRGGRQGADGGELSAETGPRAARWRPGSGRWIAAGTGRGSGRGGSVRPPARDLQRRQLQRCVIWPAPARTCALIGMRARGRVGRPAAAPVRRRTPTAPRRTLTAPGSSPSSATSPGCCTAGQLMPFSGPVASGHSCCDRRRRGSTSQARNAHFRRLRVKAGWRAPQRRRWAMSSSAASQVRVRSRSQRPDAAPASQPATSTRAAADAHRSRDPDP